jgi:hypothetical protein
VDCLKLFEIVSALLVVVSSFILMFPKRYGFYILNLANVLCFIVFYYKDLHYYMLQIIALSVLNFISIYRWRKKGIG